MHVPHTKAFHPLSPVVCFPPFLLYTLASPFLASLRMFAPKAFIYDLRHSVMTPVMKLISLSKGITLGR